MCSDKKNLHALRKIVYPWTYPTLHKAKRWYVDFYILDPATNQMREEEKKREPLTKAALSAMREHLTSQNPHFLLACYIEYYVNIRPDEMRYLKIGYIDITNCIVTLPGKFATNRYAKVKHTAHVELRDWDGDL